MSCKLGGADRGLVGTSWQMPAKVFHQTISIFAPTTNIFATDIFADASKSFPTKISIFATIYICPLPLMTFRALPLLISPCMLLNILPLAFF